MTNSHTPGPWIVTPQAAILDKHQREIAQVHNVYDQEGNYQGHNNAHLLAAAPELLAVCQMLATCNYAALSHVEAAACAAIAKAAGQPATV